MTGKHEWYKQLRGADLSHGEFRVLVILATYADANLRNAWPSQRTIAQDTGMTEESVKKLLKRLRAKGRLVVTESGGRGPGSTTTYALTKGEQVFPLGGDNPDLRGNVGSAKGERGFRSKGEWEFPIPGPTTPGLFDHSETDVSGPTDEPDLGADVRIEGQIYGWSDLSADFDLLRCWLIDELDITEAEESTALGMWQQGRHPYEVRNTIAKRRDETSSSEAVG